MIILLRLSRCPSAKHTGPSCIIFFRGEAVNNLFFVFAARNILPAPSILQPEQRLPYSSAGLWGRNGVQVMERVSGKKRRQYPLDGIMKILWETGQWRLSPRRRFPGNSEALSYGCFFFFPITNFMKEAFIKHQLPANSVFPEFQAPVPCFPPYVTSIGTSLSG